MILLIEKIRRMLDINFMIDRGYVAKNSKKNSTQDIEEEVSARFMRGNILSRQPQGTLWPDEHKRNIEESDKIKWA